MTMDLHEAIEARRTIREYGEQPIERETLLRILDAGLKAPSHNHLREWQFVLVNDMARRELLARFFFTKRTEMELRDMLDGWGMTDDRQYEMYFEGIPRQASMVLGAPVLLVPCFRQEGNLLGAKKSLHELNAFASMWAVIENLLVAAASEGIHGVTKIISRPEERDHVRATLGIPEDYEVTCYLPLGYAAADAVWHEQLTPKVEDRLHIDEWRRTG